MKKIFIIIFFGIICLSLTSCTKYEDIKPNESDYAVWDGNYIYKGNYRSKTTGEGEKVLIDEIEYNNHKYYVNLDDYTFSYFNQEIYFSFKTSSVKDKSIDSCFVVKYSPKVKDYEILFASPFEILNIQIGDVYQDNLYVYQLYDDNGYFKDLMCINLTNLECTTIENLKEIYFLDTAIMLYTTTTLYYLNPITFETNVILNFDSNSLTVQAYQSKDCDVVKLLLWHKINEESYVRSLALFDSKTKELKFLIDKSDSLYVQLIDNSDYFMLYEKKSYEYVSTVGNKINHSLNVNNKLCRFNYEDFNYEVIYEFENKDAQYLNGFIKNNTYYMEEVKVKRGWFIFKGDIKKTAYQFSLASNTLSKDKANTIKNGTGEIETVSLKGQVYFMKQQKFGIGIKNPTAISIYKKGENTNNPVLMQFFVHEYEHVSNQYDGTRSSIMMWDEDLSFNDEYVMILNY